MAAADAQRCARCSAMYRVSDTGLMGCNAHMTIADSYTDHYACCGAAPADSRCRSHADSLHAQPNGCHRVDHCATPAELLALLTERPYAITPIDKDLKSMPYAKTANGFTVFHFTDEAALDNRTFSVHVPPSWRGSNVSADGTLPVDLRAEHGRLRKMLIEREYAEQSAIRDLEKFADDPYATEWIRHTAGVEDTSTPNFVPFAVILRVHPQCSERPRQGPCIWVD